MSDDERLAAPDLHRLLHIEGGLVVRVAVVYLDAAFASAVLPTRVSHWQPTFFFGKHIYRLRTPLTGQTTQISPLTPSRPMAADLPIAT